MFVGNLHLTIKDPEKNQSFPAQVFYPTATPSVSKAFGPYVLDLSINAAVEGEQVPLVIVSHGSGSTPLVYRNLALFLAKQGYIVAMPEHPGNSRSDNSLDGTAANLEQRPRNLRQTIDAVFSDPRLSPHVKPDSVAVIGHSLGAYTALALAGAQASVGLDQKLPSARDPRVRALVLLAPVAAFFVPSDSMQDLDVPVLMFSAEEDRITPKWHAQLILDTIPNPERVIFHSIPKANHYSFLSPFPQALKRPDFAPAQDLPGFDRALFQESLHSQILSFLRT